MFKKLIWKAKSCFGRQKRTSGFGSPKVRGKSAKNKMSEALTCQDYFLMSQISGPFEVSQQTK